MGKHRLIAGPVHPWSGSKPYGSSPGREEFVAPAVDNGHKRRFHHVIKLG
jgi:hypothetical protein